MCFFYKSINFCEIRRDLLVKESERKRLYGRQQKWIQRKEFLNVDLLLCWVIRLLIKFKTWELIYKTYFSGLF